MAWFAISFVMVVLLTIVILLLRVSLVGLSAVGLVSGISNKIVKLGVKHKSIKRVSGALNTVGQLAILGLKAFIHFVIAVLSFLRGVFGVSGVLTTVVSLSVILTALVAGAGYLTTSEIDFKYVGSSSSGSKGSGTASLGKYTIDDPKLKEALEKLMKTWGSDVTDQQRSLILKGATMIGHSWYSMSNWSGRSGDPNAYADQVTPEIMAQDRNNTGGHPWEDQRLFDCASFTAWCFNQSGVATADQVSPYSTTGTFIDNGNFEYISAEDLKVGDIGLNNNDSGALFGGNHVGIFVGRKDDGTPIFIHCTGGAGGDEFYHVETGVRISTTNFTVFKRFKGWKK